MKPPDISYKPPVRIPFENKHIQVFPEGYKTETTFYKEQIGKVGEDVKLLNYTLHCVFTPEKRHRGSKPNEPATMSVHIHALVTDLASNNLGSTTDVTNPPNQELRGSIK